MASQAKRPAAISRVRIQQRWLQLCQEAAVEGDPDKLISFMREMNNLLDEKEPRLKLGRAAVAPMRRAG